VAIRKRVAYGQSIERIDKAIKEKFYLEASWIEYAICEDRCDSLLEKTGGLLTPPPGQSFVSINLKISELKKRCKTDPFLIQVIEFPRILEEVRQWKNRRNPLMHELVKSARDFTDISNDAKALAIDGQDIVRRFSGAAMKVRKKYKKAGN
jgi:hypothetical protein